MCMGGGGGGEVEDDDVSGCTGVLLWGVIAQGCSVAHVLCISCLPR